jgi:AraC-like DNA-binding protein
MNSKAAGPAWVPSVAARLYRPIALALEAQGVAAQPLFEEFGMPSPATAGWDVRLPLPQIAGIWGRLLEVTGDRFFSLRAAEHVDLTTCDVITYLESAAQSVRAALEKKFVYLPLITDAVEWTLDEGGELAVLTLHERPARPPLAPVAEYLLAARHVFFCRFGPPGWQLRFVNFRHSAPAHDEQYLRIFGVEPCFDAAADQLGFSASWLDSPMHKRDDALSELLLRYAEQVRSTSPKPLTWQERVREQLLAGVDPGMALVAQQLAVSPRTLQRSLASEGTTYAEVARGAKRAAAEQLLRRGELGISEIAFALGFSGAPAFHRAFRRWTGATPSQFRAQALGRGYVEPAFAALHDLRRFPSSTSQRAEQSHSSRRAGDHLDG